jgi:hypothetical protein
MKVAILVDEGNFTFSGHIGLVEMELLDFEGVLYGEIHRFAVAHVEETYYFGIHGINYCQDIV